jgi:RNA polymerase sigma-70 factor (ECF subfamily)
MASIRNPSDAELIRLAQQGILEAFTTLYHRYWPSVYNRVRYTIPEQDIEDVTQEIFIAVMKSLKGFRGESQFNTWLRTLVNRQVADYYRHNTTSNNQLSISTDKDDSEQLAQTNTNHNPVDMDESVALRHALIQLPEQYREILLMRFADGLRFNEIALISGKSLEATKSLFRRAVAELRKQVEQTNG